ncbi:hypothetical protein RIF29_00835 [Crotalaria pallida]|uniref:Uncharacterized protein n=1 Tax=Crotalaria pallida TaxID=3830 RepID=A0AAN9P7R6_CROPI
MARKKGRPPKSPSPDLLYLEDIDALSPKKVASILRKLDALRSRIKGKAIEGDKEGKNTEDVPNQPDTIEKEEGSVPIENVEAASQAVKEVIQNQCEEVSVVNESQMESGEVQALAH